MSKRKRRLFDGLHRLKAARGDGRIVILEISSDSGSGANLQYYPDGARIIGVQLNSMFEAPLSASLKQMLGQPGGENLAVSPGVCREHARCGVRQRGWDGVVSTRVTMQCQCHCHRP